MTHAIPVYHCRWCHYTFVAVIMPDICPDCGLNAVAPATSEQIDELWQVQSELREQGIIPEEIPF